MSNVETIALWQRVASAGHYPSRRAYEDPSISRYMMGMVHSFAYGGDVWGMLPADGRKLSVRDYPALFATIYDHFGGDRDNDFALPDLRGRVAVGGEPGPVPAVSYQALGALLGAKGETVTLPDLRGKAIVGQP